MGTFLRIVGIVVMCLGVVLAVFTVIGVRGWIGFLTQSVPSEEPSFAPPPFSDLVWAGGFGGVLGGFGLFVGGASLFCLGTIYNEVRSLRGR
jgi:hypothetical protein|uniref:Uncharacterized protein n=1 Tax=Candidatus Caldatribacterium californiense TaxID=1454726 RepID=A0A7V3YH37_9BACT